MNQIHTVKGDSAISAISRSIQENSYDWVSLVFEKFPQLVSVIPFNRDIYWTYIKIRYFEITPPDAFVLLSQYYISTSIFSEPWFFIFLFPKLDPEDFGICGELFDRAINKVNFLTHNPFERVLFFIHFLHELGGFQDLIDISLDKLQNELVKKDVAFWEVNKFFLDGILPVDAFEATLPEKLHAAFLQKKINIDQFLSIIGKVPGKKSESLLIGTLLAEDDINKRSKIQNIIQNREHNLFSPNIQTGSAPMLSQILE